MQILSYFNVVTRSFTTVFEPYRTLKKVGDTYQVNNVLLSILELEVKKPLRIPQHKLHTYRDNIGNTFIEIGNSIKKRPKKTVEVVYKSKYPFWKDSSL